jgi:signal peptidase I
MAVQGPAQPRRRGWRIVYWVTFGLLWAAAVGLLGGAITTMGFVRAATASMADTIQRGDPVLYQRGTSGIVRGDLVMVQVPGMNGLVIRRVIGLAGDRVSCCDSAGRVTVNGKALTEDYLAQGVSASQNSFAVTVSPGQMWVMGDNRAIAIDSRIWGPLAMSDVSGRVIEVRGSLVRTPAAFTADGLAPNDLRFPLPLLLAALAVIAVLTAIVLGAAGTVLWAVRRRRKLRQQPAPTSW